MTISSHLRSLVDRKTHISSVPSSDLQSGPADRGRRSRLAAKDRSPVSSAACPPPCGGAPQLPTRTGRPNRNGGARPSKRAACEKVGVMPRNRRRAEDDLAREDYRDPPPGFAGGPPQRAHLTANPGQFRSAGRGLGAAAPAVTIRHQHRALTSSLAVIGEANQNRLERINRVRDEEAAGSNPATPTEKFQADGMIARCGDHAIDHLLATRWRDRNPWSPGQHPSSTQTSTSES
jgi:hypothetical protein